MASRAYLDYTWQPGNACVSEHARPAAARPALIDRTVPLSLPKGARLLSDFLDEFEADPEMAEPLAAARAEIAAEFQAAQGHSTLRELRLARGLSQTEFATLLETSQSRVSRLESRQDKPGEEALRAMAHVLEVDFNTLMEALAHGD